MARQVDKKKKSDPFAEYETVEEDPFAEFESITDEVLTGTSFDQPRSIVQLPQGTSNVSSLNSLPPQIPQEAPEEEESNFLKQIWDSINTPMVDAGLSPEMRAHSEEQNPYIGKGMNFLTDLMSGSTSLLNVATAGAFGGSAALRLAGKLPQISRGLMGAGKALSAPVAASGAINTLHPDSTNVERVLGLLEMAGGAAGMRAKLPQISKSIVDDDLSPPLPWGSVKDSKNVNNTPQHTIVDIKNPNPQNLITDGADVIDEATGEVVDMSSRIESPKLPRELQGARPTYNMGLNSYVPKFESDLDKALYIIAQKNPSKQDARYLKFVMENTGLDEAGARTAGVKVRSQLKDIIKNSEPGDVQIPSLFTQAGAPPIKPPVKPPVLAEIPSIHPETKAPIDPVKHKPVVKVVNNKEAILNNPSVETVQQMNDNNYYTRRVNEDGSLVMTKRAPRPVKTEAPASLTREIYNLPRGLMSVDLPFATSAAFRQAKPFIGTGNWFKAWGTAAKSFGSEEAFQSIMNRINHKPLFQKRLIKGRIGPSVAEEMGLDMTDLKGINGREEALRSSLAEKIPLYGRYIRASNRAYTGFLNDLRANTLEDLFDSAKAIGRDPLTQDKVLGQGIAEFINTATGRGKLGIELGSKQISLEKNAKLMADVFFAPKLMASNVRMLNPSTYITADPFIRKQYMLGMLRSMGTWGTIAGMAKLAGADVTLDPRSSDFAKIKIGNTRIDLGGGMQQYLVLAAREIKGQTKSSTSNDITEFGKGFKAPTGVSTAVKFGSQKLHPTAKFAWDMLNASEYETVGVGDRVLEMALPMYIGDLKEILEENPELAPLILGLTSVGIGSQTYEGGPPKPNIIPRKYDYVYKGQ